MNLRRREFCQGAGALGLLSSASGTGLAKHSTPIVKTAYGALAGASERGVFVFRGVPYGGSVSGPDRRFRPPTPPTPWTGVREATSYGAPSIQPTASPGEPAPAEDCLFLNVWTPNIDQQNRPVMFYCHGGGFTIGSGSRSWQNGANLARNGDVVVVECNHRLGALGYLYLGDLLGPEYAGNQGLLDLVAALTWVKENIAGFGGNPNNIMIFGESGGGGKASCLYAMPSAAPLFAKASIESPIGPGDRSREEVADVAEQAMHALRLTDPRQLLTVPAAQLLQFQTNGDNTAPGTRSNGRDANSRDRQFWPFIDGTILPASPFKEGAPLLSADKPLIVGGCKDEAVFFSMSDPSAFNLTEQSLRDRLSSSLHDRADEWISAFRKSRPGASPSQLYMAITTAIPWRAHAVHIAEAKAEQQRASVFSYILQYQSPLPVPGTNYPGGSPHASDIATKFDNVGPQPGDPPGSPPGPLGDATAGRRKTAANMSAMWAAFAHRNDPSISGQPRWTPYDLRHRQTMLIDAQCRLESDPESAERLFWRNQPNSEVPV